MVYSCCGSYVDNESDGTIFRDRFLLSVYAINLIAQSVGAFNPLVKVKVTVTRKLYATLRHPKLYPTSKNLGDKNQTRSGTDRLTVRLYMPPKVPLGA